MGAARLSSFVCNLLARLPSYVLHGVITRRSASYAKQYAKCLSLGDLKNIRCINMPHFFLGLLPER